MSGVGVVAPSARCKHARFVVLRPPPQLCNISQLVNYDTPYTPFDLMGLMRCSLSKCIGVSTTPGTASWTISRGSLPTAARNGWRVLREGRQARHREDSTGNRCPAQSPQELFPAKLRRSPSEVRSLGTPGCFDGRSTKPGLRGRAKARGLYHPLFLWLVSHNS